MFESLRSLTYISKPAQPFDAEALQLLASEATRLNALDGITGLLVFNGRRFCQTIEGSIGAIDHLLEKLRRDPRHHGLVVTADNPVDTRRFGTWRMRALFLTADNADAVDPKVREHLDTVDPHRWFWAA